MKHMKNNYTLYARTYPALISLLPFTVLGTIFSIELKNWIPIITSVGFVSTGAFFLGQIGRDAGKKKESRLWVEWGGSPSVQILRHFNEHINKHTKKLYHQKLQSLCPVDPQITEEYEKQYPEKADEVYWHWTQFVIAQTRDINQFNLLFQENRNYGFRRNLWGLKSFAIGLILLAIAGDFIYFWYTEQSQQVNLWSNEFFISESILFLALLLWIFLITKGWVKVTSFAYAERLFESVHHIKREENVTHN